MGLGSGCGVNGGNVVKVPNGGAPVPGYPAGFDIATLPDSLFEKTVWQRGSTVEVAFAIMANHGGGYSWRLCKKGQPITEECFQQNVLSFAPGNVSWLQYSDLIPNHHGYIKLQRFEIPRVVVSEGTFPGGSEWARNPVPSCSYCDQTQCGNLLPNLTEPVDPAPVVSGDDWFGGEAWWKQEQCAQDCSGFSLMQCPPGMTQFPEPAPGISGYLGNYLVDIHSEPVGDVGTEGFPFSIVDEDVLPSNLEVGDYLLSWRWDAEQSPQIWQNCTDILIEDATLEVSFTCVILTEGALSFELSNAVLPPCLPLSGWICTGLIRRIEYYSTK